MSDETTVYSQELELRKLLETLLGSRAPDAETNKGSGVKVQWSGASIVEDPQSYFEGDPKVLKQLQFAVDLGLKRGS